jgi:hypothetical protein
MKTVRDDGLVPLDKGLAAGNAAEADDDDASFHVSQDDEIFYANGNDDGAQRDYDRIKPRRVIGSRDQSGVFIFLAEWKGQRPRVSPANSQSGNPINIHHPANDAGNVAANGRVTP